ncbi:hypothetical protein ACIQD3_14875 [Peribacillus loiseleuriae]|uniref:hypothetical protein n=1 Tax=Peribacillus loiseleuriae TaxID=1679170 RepID=UPI0037FEA2B2
MQLLRLVRLSGDYSLKETVHGIFNTFASGIIRYPLGNAYMLQAYLTSQMSMKEVVILTGDQEASFLKKLQQDFYPEVTYLAGNSSDKLSEFAPFAEGYEKEAIYICENFVLH